MKRTATFLILILSLAPAQAASDFAGQVLAAHNTERASLGIPPMVWSAALAKDAAVWATALAASGQFQHSPPDQRVGEGENLWKGTAGGYTPDQMAGMWAAEKKDYSYGVFTGGIGKDGHPIGHYTQMIWRNTTQVGCALATGGGNDVLVCRYSPAGNYLGQMPY
jgi:uncharacterized protein YkwD